MKLWNERVGILLLLAILVGCSSPPEEPIENAKLIQSLNERDQDPELIQTALEVLAPEELALLEDNWKSKLSDPRSLTYWRARALAWEPNLRQARRRYLDAVGRFDSAGFPGPIGGRARTTDFSEPDLSNEVVLTFDLLGIFGVGPVAAAEALAEARVRQAFADLEQSAWSASFDVIRALVALQCARGQLADLRVQLAESAKGKKRAVALQESGRIGMAPRGRVVSFCERLATRVANQETQVANARARLAAFVGAMPEAKVLDAVSVGILDVIENRLAASAVSDDRQRLLSNHPMLRSLRLRYAVAEADVRNAAAQAWPTINLGPRFDIRPDDLLTGGLMRFSLPWPGSIEGQVDAALSRRAAARERLEDALIAATSRIRAAQDSIAALRPAYKGNAPAAYAESAGTWRGMTARFMVDERSWDLWTDSLGLRQMAIMEYWQVRQSYLLASLQLVQDAGGQVHE